MDFDRTDLFQILFLEGREDLNPGECSGMGILLQDHPYGCLPNKSGNCPAGRLRCLPDETEDILQGRIDPNEVYRPRSPTGSPEREGGISKSPFPEPLPPARRPALAPDVVRDMETLEDPNPHGNRSSPGTHPPACTASQAPVSFFEGAARLKTAEVPTEQLQPPGLLLTEEERRLLSQEGVLLHNALRLSQGEERILKKIRRKIRNKQSAQDSRQRKKEYLEGLESQAAACSAQNEDLKQKVQQLEKHKESLLDELRKLQGLLTQTASRAAQTSTCLVILLVSFGLFIWPTCSSFYGGSRVGPPGGPFPKYPDPKGIL